MFKLSNDNLIKSASYLSVIISVLILLIKGYGWGRTGSQSMLASLIDSMLDISSSVINLIAVRVSLLPPDDNHRFGHEKFQDLAIFSQSMFFFASCVFILFSSTKALVLRETVENGELGANTMFACIALTFILVVYQTLVIRRTKSTIISADKLHYFSDFLANIAVVVSLYLSEKYWYIDGVAGIAISLYILQGSYKLFKHAIRNLADEEFPPEDKKKVLEIIGQFKEARGIHELKTRYAANKPFIQFHLEMDAELSLRSAHDIAENIVSAIEKEFPNAEVIIHQDPEGEEVDVNYRERFRT